VDTEAADGGMQAVDDSGAASPASDEAATDAVDVGPASLGTLANPLPKLKMPLSAYMLFAGAKRAEVREANPTKSVAQQAEVLGALWRSLTDEEKKVSVPAACGVVVLCPSRQRPAMSPALRRVEQRKEERICGRDGAGALWCFVHCVQGERCGGVV